MGILLDDAVKAVVICLHKCTADGEINRTAYGETKGIIRVCRAKTGYSTK